MNLYDELPDEDVDEMTVELVMCAYPYGIPDAHYKTLLSILKPSRSIRSLASVVARVRGGHYTTYMGEVGNAERYEPDSRVRETVMQKLKSCGFDENPTME